MPFRFRKSVRLFPGVRVNLSKSGMSVSVGGPGATLNLGPRGSAVTLGLPGTGLSYRHQLTTKRRPTPAPPLERRPAPDPRWNSRPEPPPAPEPEPPPVALPVPGEIRSAEVATLTSTDLQGLKALLNEAAQQRASLQTDLTDAEASRLKAWRRLRRREQLPLRLFMKAGIPQARAAFEETEAELVKVLEAIALSAVRVEFVLDDRARAAQTALAAAHDRLARVRMIWDVLSSVAIDRVRERTTAGNAVTRTPVHLSRVNDSIIAGNQVGLRFQNANGADLDFFPGFLLVRERGAQDYALIDLREVSIEAKPVSFLESEAVPYDAEVIGQTWAKANKDGSPDRRFKDNVQIPVVRYGGLTFSTPGGIREAYHASDAEAALGFGQAFAEMQAALRALGHKGPSVPTSPAAAEGLGVSAAPLPALPDVRGAHELTAFAAAALGALVFLAYPGPPSEPKTSLALAEVRIPAEAAAPALRGSEPAASPVRARPAETPKEPIGAPAQAAVAALPPAVSAAAPSRERMVLKQNANLRAGPDRNATAIRVVPIASTVAVFGKTGSWVQVGDAVPWGWIHASVLSPAP